jgi:hypothetical protein
MSRELSPVIPMQIRAQINFDMRGDSLAMLDDNARFIIRRMVGRAYQQGFDDGWTAGQDDYRTDRDIRRDAEAAS